MAGIDKIYGTEKQYNQLHDWLKENQIPINCKTGFDWDVERKCIIDQFEDVWPLDCLYPKAEVYNKKQPISNFPSEIDFWLLKHCPLKFVIRRIKEQHNL